VKSVWALFTHSSPLFTLAVSTDLQSAKRTGGRNAILLEAVVVKSGEEWVKSQKKLFTPRNPDKHRGFRRKGEE
jgi:hypothetical protein